MGAIILAFGAIYAMVGYAENAQREQLIAVEHRVSSALLSQLDALLTISDLHFEGDLPFLRAVIEDRIRGTLADLDHLLAHSSALLLNDHGFAEIRRIESLVESDLVAIGSLLGAGQSSTGSTGYSEKLEAYWAVSDRLPENMRKLIDQISYLILQSEQSMLQAKTFQFWFLGVAFPLIFLLVYIAFSGLKTRMLLPVMRISEVEESAQVHALFYSERAEFPTDKLPQAISRIVQNLLESFKHYEARIDQRAQQLVDKTERLESQTKILQEALVVADEGNQAKTRFIASVSHETRTPLNAIIGLSDILKEDDLSDEQLSHVGLIRKSGEHLLEIINDVLSVSSGSKKAGSVESCDFRSLVEEVLFTRNLTAGVSHLKVHVEISDDFPESVKIPVSRVKQVLLNLIENAFRNTQVGHITVRAKLERLGARGRVTRLVTEVEDTGCGISKEDQQKIFEPFTQLKNRPKQESDGTDSSSQRDFFYGGERSAPQSEGIGLGLAIVASMCASMGGSVSVESRLGEGSTFRFTLPVSQD